MTDSDSPTTRHSGTTRTMLFIFLVALSLTFLLPFFWQLAVSLTTNDDVDLVSRTLWPHSIHWSNFRQVFLTIPLARYFFNSILVAGWVTLLQVVTSAMAAYAFARMQWPGREKVFLLYLSTMMIPGAVLMVPDFAIILKLHMYDSYAGLIIPAAFSAFGTFLLRQFMLTIPRSLDEAAIIDGAGDWKIFWDVILPMCRPGLITLAIFAFIGNYSSFFWPLILTKSANLRTLPIGLLSFSDDHGTDIPGLMAASLLAMIPLIILFVILQKYLVRGIQLGAVKG